MKYFLLLGALAFSAGCTTKKSEQTDTSQPVATNVVEAPACYSSVMGQDTMRLYLENTGEVVIGDLTYNFYEKDDNQGTLRGQMRGDTLLADYTFMSEGIESVRQIVFLKKDGGFVEGYGDAEDRDGKMIFTNTAALDFTSGTVFAKVPCVD